MERILVPCFQWFQGLNGSIIQLHSLNRFFQMNLFDDLPYLVLIPERSNVA